MPKLNRVSIFKAEAMRYEKIQKLIGLLQGKEKLASIGTALDNDFPSVFEVGRGMWIDGERIRIGKKSVNSYEIQKITVNTEGSMSVYDIYGKKLIGSLRLNVSLKNIEMFCIWVWKNNIPVEVLSGKTERLFQYIILSIAVIEVLLLKLLKVW